MRTATRPAHAVVKLPADPDCAAELGGKGGWLNRMLAGGLEVPPTAVVTAAAYRHFAENAGIREIVDLARREPVAAEIVNVAFLSAPLDDRLSDEIFAAARDVGHGATIAVRSSANAEDMAGLSFAGQYHSELDVDSRDADAVLRAVRLTWASLWHPAPCAYRTLWGIADDTAAMSVVLMRMVPAQLAGVTFTVDPAGGAERMRIEAVTGLADTLVSGERTPQVWLPPRDPAATSEHSTDLLGGLVLLGRRVERLLGGPQDIEWAWDGERTWLVQSRPITTDRSGDGCDSPVDDAELMSGGVDEMLPGVLPPLIWDLNAFLVEEAFRRAFDDLGVNPPERTGGSAIVRRVRGRAALDLDMFKQAASRLPDVSEHDLEREYFGTPADAVPTARRRRLAVRRDLRVFAARQRAVVEAETVLVAVNELTDAECPSPADLDDAALVAYRARLIDLAARAMTSELAVAAAAAASYRRLERLLGRYADASRAASDAQRLTAGAGAVATASPRASRSVFAGPTWSETGQPVPRPGARAWPDRPIDRQHGQHEIENRLRRHPRWRRNRALTGQIIDVQLRGLRAAVNDATTGLARREKVKAAVLLLGGLVRSVHLELGRRLCARGYLEGAADVDLLCDAELRAAMAGRRPAGGALTLRKRWRERHELAGELPQRFVGVPPETIPPALSGRIMHGWAASGGRYTGRARALTEPVVDSLNPGDVLVTSATDSAWTPVFSQAGAIVVERGGPLSHAAVVARELGLPAVLNVPGAATHLDGRTVTVDGDNGQVIIHDQPSGAPVRSGPAEVDQLAGEPR
ncbi:MAG TPA: PEP/pyruvate-binding domain-containing protein [Jiangellaceae bacterium]